MRVLSLFDGMACGRIALDRLGIVPSIYMASEIDKSAMHIAQSNWPDIVQLGDVRNVRQLAQIGALGPIDLLLAGSPCQGFSNANQSAKGFDDPRSGLFYEFIAIKDIVRPKNFLLENVRMKREWLDHISIMCGVDPVFINSADFSGQARRRFYWTNLKVQRHEPKNIRVMDLIDVHNCKPNHAGYHNWFLPNKEKQLRKKWSTIVNDVEKAQCIVARYPKSWNGNIYRIWDEMYRFLTVTECERLQTLPEGYTRHVNDNDAYHAIGNGWTVDVITHVLRGLVA